MTSEYLDLFISELEENIKILNEQVLKLESDNSDENSLNEIMRATHTVKGMAQTMGYENIAQLAHTTETCVTEIIEKGNLDLNLVENLFHVADRFSQFSSKLQKKEDITHVLVNDLTDLLGSHQYKERGEEDDLRVSTNFKISVIFSSTTKLRGVRGYQILRELEKIATIEQSTPNITIIEEGELNQNPEFEIVTNEDEQKLHKVLGGISDISSVEITSLLEKTTDLSKSDGAKHAIQSVRVNLTEVDVVLDLLGELILAKNRMELNLSELVSPKIVDEFHEFEQIIKQIQNNLTKMRMVSLSRIFETYPRTIRDITKERKIEAEILLQGTHIELDRSVIDQVNEALLHLIRNSATHGIELPETRKSQSKKAKGRIIVSAVQERGEVVFKVSDDGAGLDFKKIRKKAIKQGIISKTTVLSEEKLAPLIFEPNFSTANLTMGAGRGIGLDIVKSTIEEVGGTIQVESSAREGTTFMFRVPQTVAIIQALVVRIHDYLFALPMLNIEKIFSINDPAISFRENNFIVATDKMVIEVTDLEERLSIPDHFKSYYIGRKFKEEGKKKIIIWRKGEKKVAMKVTEIYEQREIVTKELDTWVQNYPGLSGATILDEDQVVLIIDPATI